MVWGQRSEEIGAELEWATQSFSGGAVEDLDGVVTFAELAEGVGAVAEGMASLLTLAMAMTAMAMTAMTVVTVMALIHRALDDATEDTAEDTAQEGFSRGGLLNDGLGVGDGNDLRGSRSDRLQTRDTGQIKAGHVNGGFEEELAGLT